MNSNSIYLDGIILQAAVNGISTESCLYIENNGVILEQRLQVEIVEDLVGHCGNHCVVAHALVELVGDFDAIFAADSLGVGPRVIDRDAQAVFTEGADDVDDLGIAHVGAVLLEGEAENQNLAVENLDAFLKHELHNAVGDIGAHAVVHAASGEDDLGVVAVALRTLGEIVGVYSDAVAADKSGLERKEVPFRRGGLEDIGGVDAHEGEDLRELVDESDIDVALRVLDDLGGLGDLDRRGEMGSGRYDARIYPVDIFANLRCRAGGHLADLLHGVELVARIDALGRIAGEEVGVEFQAADLLDHGDTLVFGDAGIDGRLIDDDIARSDDASDCLAGSVERREVGIIVLVDGCGNGYHIEVAVADVVDICGASEAVVVDRIAQQVVTHLKGGIVAGHQRLDAAGVHVEPDSGIFRREKPGQRQTDIAQSDNAYSDIFFHCCGLLVVKGLPYTTRSPRSVL